MEWKGDGRERGKGRVGGDHLPYFPPLASASNTTLLRPQFTVVKTTQNAMQHMTIELKKKKSVNKKSTTTVQHWAYTTIYDVCRPRATLCSSSCLLWDTCYHSSLTSTPPPRTVWNLIRDLLYESGFAWMECRYWTEPCIQSSTPAAVNVPVSVGLVVYGPFAKCK